MLTTQTDTGGFLRAREAIDRAQTIMERGRNKEAELELNHLITEALHLKHITQQGKKA